MKLKAILEKQVDINTFERFPCEIEIDDNELMKNIEKIISDGTKNAVEQITALLEDI